MVLFVDEIPRDIKRYTNLLSEDDKIQTTPIFPPKHIDDISLSPKPDLILIDYLLTNRQPSGISASYRGGTLATYISEQLPDTPLVLFSTRGILSDHPNYEEEIQAIDYVLYKEDVNIDQENAKKLLINIANSFKLLSSVENIDRNWKKLMILLNANEIEEENLQRSSPPRRMTDEKWSVKSVAKWILKTLLKYPGIFYNSLYAASSLGISESSFLRDEVQSYFKDAYYQGIFSDIEKRWWKDRLQKIGFQCIREANLKPLLSDTFMLAFQKNTGIELQPSICIYSGEKNANTVCYILCQPVKMKYTLGYIPDERPESMEQARISYKAVIEEEIKEEFIPKADAERLPSIRGG